MYRIRYDMKTDMDRWSRQYGETQRRPCGRGSVAALREAKQRHAMLLMTVLFVALIPLLVALLQQT